MDEGTNTQKTITDRWLDNLYESLMRLEQYEKLAREGCESLMEYVQNPNLDLALIQNKNYGLFITELEITLNNCRHLIDKDKRLKITLEIKSILKKELEVKGFLSEKRDLVMHTTRNVLKPSFYIVLRKISALRRDLVSSLWFILSPKAKDILPE